MANEFLGNGWLFPILPDATGTLRYVAGDANVEQSLRVLLLTQVGERVMRPDFGTQAPRLVFSPGSSQYLRLLETSISDAIRDFEPRIDVLDIQAEQDPGAPNHVTVSISYRVRQSNTQLNLVFPFYLGTVEAS